MSDAPQEPEKNEPPPPAWNFQGNLVAGVLTVLPLAVVWFVLDFVLALLSEVGKPFIAAIAGWTDGWAPWLAAFLLDGRVHAVAAAIFAVLLLYLVGAVATQVLGARLIEYVERLIARIPFVTQIYGATKKLIGALQQKPEGAQRVVLIEFPHPGMKAIGLVTRTFRDAASGAELAAVFVPTTPNPTSGYLEIVPVERLVPTRMTLDEAMTMIISGGSVAPAEMPYENPRRTPAAAPHAASGSRSLG